MAEKKEIYIVAKSGT